MFLWDPWPTLRKHWRNLSYLYELNVAGCSVYLFTFSIRLTSFLPFVLFSGCILFNNHKDGFNTVFIYNNVNKSQITHIYVNTFMQVKKNKSILNFFLLLHTWFHYRASENTIVQVYVVFSEQLGPVPNWKMFKEVNLEIHDQDKSMYIIQ